MSELHEHSALELRAAYADGSASPVEAAEACLARIAAHDEVTNGFCLVDEEATLAQARASAARWQAGAPEGALDGVPVAVKDLLLTRGWPTRRGSLVGRQDGPWDADAPTVTALRRHGATLVGKTTTPELGWKGVTDSPAAGVTTNPWDHTKTPGGSSGGSATAVAQAMAPLAIGTDGGGSIRIPAAFTGVVGHKPTYGLVPLWPPSPYGTLAHAGPMSWTVSDTALLLDVLATPDPRDWTQLAPPTESFLDAIGAGVAGRRVAFSADLGWVRVDPEVAALVEQAVAVLAELGAEVEQVDPGFADPVDVFATLWNSGAAGATAALDDDELDRLDPGLHEIVLDGRSRTALEVVEATVARGELGVEMGRFHERYDLLVTPTLPIAAFEAGCEVPEGSAGRRWTSWTPFTYPFNLTQQPAASVPCGFTAAGLPVGLQIVGPRHADARVLQAAHAYQQARPLTDRRPD